MFKLSDIKLSQVNANWIIAIASAWLSLAALHQIPENVYTHWLNIVAAFVIQVLINMGYSRTAAGNTIPDPIKQLVDSAANERRERRANGEED